MTEPAHELTPDSAARDEGPSGLTLPHDEALEIDLCDAILREMLLAMGRSADGPARRLLGPLLRLPAARFAWLMAGADACVARSGMTAGAAWLLSHLVQGAEVRGAEAIPATGPLVIASNHPGAYDSLAIIANLPARGDLAVLASDIPFFRRLPSISPNLIYVSPNPHERMGAVRAMIGHLRAGGALMTFGSGLVDPDPDLLPGATEALESWYESLALVMRRVLETRLVLTIVSGVVAPAYTRSPLTRLARTGWEQRKLAEFLQISMQLLTARKPALTPRVSFGEPIAAADLVAGTGEPITMQPIVERAKVLLEAHMAASASPAGLLGRRPVLVG